MPWLLSEATRNHASRSVRYGLTTSRMRRRDLMLLMSLSLLPGIWVLLMMRSARNSSAGGT